jgi:hypothetical protein
MSAFDPKRTWAAQDWCRTSSHSAGSPTADFRTFAQERVASISAPIWCPLRQITLYLASVSASKHAGLFEFCSGVNRHPTLV